MPQSKGHSLNIMCVESKSLRFLICFLLVVLDKNYLYFSKKLMIKNSSENKMDNLLSRRVWLPFKKKKSVIDFKKPDDTCLS